MRKVIIKIPKDNKSKWLIGFGNKPRSMLRADTLLSRLRRMLPSWLKVDKKTSVIVKRYVDGAYKKENETLISDNEGYLLFCASCFLEDYVSKATLKKYEKTNT